ncbi:MAG: sulfate adenylyltransferase, partial [Nitrospirae bacterium]
MALVRPHGKDRTLKVLLVHDEEKEEQLKRAEGLKKVPINSR